MNLSILLYVRKCEQGYAMEVVDTKVFTTLGSIKDRVHNVVVNLTDGYNNFTPGKPVTVESDQAIAVLNAIREAVKTHDNPGMNPFAEKWFADEAEDAYKIALMKSVRLA